MWISYGKSRVASLKTNTVPRMEQTAAVVSVKLHKLIVEQLDLPIHKAVFWTDSTIVLQYIRNEARRFQKFLAKRLSVIQGASSPCQWRHVDSLRNTAYYDPRGFSTAETVKLRCWLNGPSFLDQDESEWPRLRDEMPELPEEDREGEECSSLLDGRRRQFTVPPITLFLLLQAPNFCRMVASF